MFGLGVLVLLTPFWWIPTLIKCLVVTYGGKLLFRIGKDDYTPVPSTFDSLNPLFSVVIKSWIIDMAASVFSVMFMLFISGYIPQFSRVHSEFRHEQERTYGDSFLYMAITLALYALILLTVYFVYKKRIENTAKRVKMLCLFIVSSVPMLGYVGYITM